MSLPDKFDLSFSLQLIMIDHFLKIEIAIMSKDKDFSEWIPRVGCVSNQFLVLFLP